MEEILQEYENHGQVYDLIERIRPMIGRYVRDSSQNLGILIGLWKNDQLLFGPKKVRESVFPESYKSYDKNNIK